MLRVEIRIRGLILMQAAPGGGTSWSRGNRSSKGSSPFHQPCGDAGGRVQSDAVLVLESAGAEVCPFRAGLSTAQNISCQFAPSFQRSLCSVHQNHTSVI